MATSTNFVKSLIAHTKPQRKVEQVDRYLVKNELAEETVARVLMCGILKNQFYRSQDDAAKEALPLFISMSKKDPDYLLKAACFARNGHMKGMVKVALAALSGNANQRFLNRRKTRRGAVALLSTFHPGQLIQFVELCKSKVLGRGFGSRPQKWVRDAMEGWTPGKLEVYTLKYPGALNQLVRLVHPRYTDERGGLIRYVLDGRKEEATGEKQTVVERLKRPRTQKKTIANAILDHNIPWDVIKGFAGLEGPIAIAAMTQMGLTALLLNIRSLEQHGVFSTPEGIKALKMKMQEVQNGRSIPLDFAKPYIHNRDQKIRNVLLDGMVATLDVPMPHIESKRVGVSIDISGSMSGEPLQTAGLIGVPFLKAKSLWLTTFDTGLYEENGMKVTTRNDYWGSRGHCPKVQGLSRRKQVEALLNLQTSGATNVSISVQEAVRRKIKLDVHVLITDEQQNSGTPLMTVWKQYKRHVNPRAQLWVINATNYQWHSANFDDPSVTVYQTMTPAIFKNLQYAGIDLVDQIKKLDLDEFTKRNLK
jgi:hypothetical protein